MYEICRHIKTNGLRCQSPALKGSAYCYYHARSCRVGKSSAGLWDDVRLPVLEDASAVQLALSEVVDALLSSRVDTRRAGLLLYALQIASQNLCRIEDLPDNARPVLETNLAGDGEELAPVQTICEPVDCLSCPQRLTCDGENLAQPPRHSPNGTISANKKNRALPARTTPSDTQPLVPGTWSLVPSP